LPAMVIDKRYYTVGRLSAWPGLTLADEVIT
jgi:hypothetical protein